MSLSTRMATLFNDPQLSDCTLVVSVRKSELNAIGEESPRDCEPSPKRIKLEPSASCPEADASCPQPTATCSDPPASCQASSRTFRVLRGVLSVASPYFDKLFTGSFREASAGPQDLVNLEVTESEADQMEVLFRFCYSDQLPETQSSGDLLTLLHLSDRYQVAECVTQCCQKLQQRQLEFEDSPRFFEILRLLRHYPAVLSLSETAKHVVDNRVLNFDSFKETDLFRRLTAPAMRAYLDLRHLASDNELSLFHTVVDWAHGLSPGNPGELEERLGEVLPAVHFACIGTKSLRTISTRPEMSTPLMQDLIHKALWCKLHAAEKRSEHRFDAAGGGVSGMEHCCESPCAYRPSDLISVEVHTLPLPLARAKKCLRHTVYMSVAREQLQSVEVEGRVRSRDFGVEGHDFRIVLCRHVEGTFGLYLCLMGEDGEEVQLKRRLHVQGQTSHWTQPSQTEVMHVLKKAKGEENLEMGDNNFLLCSWQRVLTEPSYFTHNQMIITADVSILRTNVGGML